MRKQKVNVSEITALHAPTTLVLNKHQHSAFGFERIYITHALMLNGEAIGVFARARGGHLQTILGDDYFSDLLLNYRMEGEPDWSSKSACDLCNEKRGKKK